MSDEQAVKIEMLQAQIEALEAENARMHQTLLCALGTIERLVASIAKPEPADPVKAVIARKSAAWLKEQKQ